MGNTTIADPKEVAKEGDEVKPLPAAPKGAVPDREFVPASPLEVVKEPEWDPESCQTEYPDGEAKIVVDPDLRDETVYVIEENESDK